MTSNRFNEVVKEQLAYCESLLCKKSEEYDRDGDDRLYSFKKAAALQHETPMQALAGMMCKHTTSVYDLIADDVKDVNLWTEKITDHINYLLLLKGLVLENAEKEKAESIGKTNKKG